MTMDDELKAKARDKAREFLEMLFERDEEKSKEMFVEHYLPDFEQKMHEHYEKHGEWPLFHKNPDDPDDWTVTSNLNITGAEEEME